MATVELLFFPDCPNVPAAREQLRRAFDVVGVDAQWTEVDVTAEAAPARVRDYGSPSILVDGRDVMGVEPGSGSCCRVYTDSNVRCVPPLDAIVSALRAAFTAADSEKSGAGSSLAVVPGALLSLLPVVSCPSCWPAYAGVLGSLGVPFLMDTTWLLPITVGALLVALAGLAYRARQRRGFGPLLVGTLAAVTILVGKFVFKLDAAVYVGTTFLVGASAWNSRPKKVAPACDAGGCPRVNATT